MWKPDLAAPFLAVARWHLTSQYGARRNALVACTALAQRRRERDEVEQLFADLNRPSSSVPEDSVGAQQISM